MTDDAPRLGIYLPSYAATDPGSWDHLIDRARAADKAGVDRVVVSDHVVFGENLEAYSHSGLGGREGGRQPTGPDGLWLEPLTVLAVICGVTSRVRLTTSILQAALRRPVVLAKAAATLDVLSGGRLDLGVGVGWQREEYVAAGLEFEGRGRLLDQTLAVLQTLWRDSPARFESADLTFDAIHCMPQPRQVGGVPIWVSGNLHERVVSRFLRFGSGWIPWGEHVANPQPGITLLKQRLEDAGRDPTGLKVLNILPVHADASGKVNLRQTMADAERQVNAGVTDLRANLPVPGNLDDATDFLADVVQEFARVTGRPASCSRVGDG